jgi:signal transduction histidine kinase
MATSRDEVLANVFDVRRGIIDFTGGEDSLARLVRSVRHLAWPLIAILVLIVALITTVAVGAVIWPDQRVLGGAAAAAILLAGAVVGTCWRLARAKRRAESANAAKTRLLTALGDDLRKPLRAIARAGAEIDRSAFDPGEWDKIARMRLDARAMLLQLEDIRTCLEIESGSFAPETRSFDLYRLANGVVASLRPQAAERGIVLTLRIDPLLPYQLRGWPHQLRQILIGLLTHVVQHSGKTKLRLVLDAAELETERICLRLAVFGGAADPPALEKMTDPPAATPGRPFGMAMVQRLAALMGGRLAIALMGGRLAIERDPTGGVRLAVELPFAVDRAMLALPLDLAHLPALIATKDQNFVGEFVEPLDSWRADPRWIGAGDTALQYLAAFDALGRRPLLIVDGRGDVLQALSFAHRAVGLSAGPPPYLLFVADEARMDSVIGFADEDFDGILPAPFTTGTLRGVLHAMRVEPADWFLADTLPVAAEEKLPAPPAAPAAIAPLELAPAPRPTPAAIVTEIASHPRFAESGGAVIDERAIGALWSLGDGSEFFDGVIEAFRADARRAIGALNAAAAAADPHQFEEGVQALRRCTANFGSGRLRELLLSLSNLAPAELQRQGSAYVQRLEAEIGKLEATLVDYAKAPR